MDAIEQRVADLLNARRNELGDLKGHKLGVWSQRHVKERETQGGAICPGCAADRSFTESDDWFRIFGIDVVAARLDDLFRAKPCGCVAPVRRKVGRDITIAYGENFETPSARKRKAMEIVNKAFGTVRSDKEHQDFEGEEPTNARAQQFNREWVEAQPEAGQAQQDLTATMLPEVEALRAQVASLKSSLHYVVGKMLESTALVVGLALERDELRAQVERMAKDKQPQLRSERRVLVDIDD